MIFAIKGDPDRREILYSTLQAGEARFGWSYVPTADLRALQARLQAGETLSPEERDCYHPFLLDVKDGDYVVYINVPAWGQCAAARVKGSYYWRFSDKDFNHRLAVDPSSVVTFDRNDAVVHPLLSSRLKLQGRYWRIYFENEFNALLEALAKGQSGRVRTPEVNLAFLDSEMQPHLQQITRVIHRTHPRTDLEVLMEQVLRRVPGVREVKRQGGAGDHGADLIVIFEAGLPIAGLEQQRTCVVQVKSFEGEHWATRAVDDIRRAFERYPEADMGLIVSTADVSTQGLGDALEKLRRDTGKQVALLIGPDVATMLLRFGAGLAPKTVQ
jgi:hypothetical protein